MIDRAAATHPIQTDKGKTLVFLINNVALPALTITELNRYRWQAESFFK